MKKLLVFTCLFLASSIYIPVKADNLDVSLLGSYGLYASWEDQDTDQSIGIDHRQSLSGRLMWVTGGEFNWELYYNRADVDVDINENSSLVVNIETYQLGAVKESDSRSMKEYYGAGLGLTRFNPEFPGARSEEDISFSFFGGVETFLTDHLALTFDARLQFVVLDSATTIICDGGCLVKIKSELWGGLQLGAGLAYRF